jgi:hypothetical protein
MYGNFKREYTEKEKNKEGQGGITGRKVVPDTA